MEDCFWESPRDGVNATLPQRWIRSVQYWKVHWDDMVVRKAAMLFAIVGSCAVAPAHGADAINHASTALSLAHNGYLAVPSAVTHVPADLPTLGPFAYARFCLRYPSDCTVHGTQARADGAEPPQWADVLDVNAEVNRLIRPERKPGGVVEQQWLLSPKFGDCNDYAVTKRHELLQRGWPSGALLLGEVATARGERHLVLVVRTDRGDSVADNLSAYIKPWSETGYQWIRIQSPTNPKFWSTVSKPRA
jgi:predicted transglutaminase-like cysteine proteinase